MKSNIRPSDPVTNLDHRALDSFLSANNQTQFERKSRGKVAGTNRPAHARASSTLAMMGPTSRSPLVPSVPSVIIHPKQSISGRLKSTGEDESLASASQELLGLESRFERDVLRGNSDGVQIAAWRDQEEDPNASNARKIEK